MKLTIGKNVLVITPTVVANSLRQCGESVSNQSYHNIGTITHLLVTDGIDDVQEESLHMLLMKGYLDYNITQQMDLPWNIGKDGGDWYGHRVYASIPKLIPTKFDYVFFLDEDNHYREDHIETCVKMMDSNPSLDFCHSLRSICDKNGRFDGLLDNCESLGRYSVWVNKDQHLVDTSSYCFRREYIREVCPIWDHGWGGDRRFFMMIMDRAKYDCTGQYTLMYHVDGNDGSVQKNFFEQGNKVMTETYNGVFPWKKA